MGGKTTRYVQAPGVELRAVGEDTFLVAAGAGTIHHLNPVGAAVWRQLEEPASLDDVLALLVAAFPDAPAGQMRDDVARLLNALEHEALIAPAAGAQER